MENTNLQTNQITDGLSILVKFKISLFANVTFLIIIFFLLILLAKSGTKIQSSQNYQISPTPQMNTRIVKTVEEKDLPIGLDILKNPVVYQWRGSVEGTLIAKDENSLTLSKNGGSILIPIKPSATLFFGLRDKSGKRKSTKLSEIEKGSYMRGEFWVQTPLSNKNKIEGSMFTVESIK